ncbi:nitroreductase family deazaflavin-dependent oxidoreductase [Nocardia sp. NBC_00511]|uniref:nitroreductase family deazaflavin-dependent oxidoreductase n=1 Tax=Nocardia sp. NBC_00511 TaxID=2903591 RepID=UPI0030E54980
MAFAAWQRRPGGPARFNPLPALGRTLGRRRFVMRSAPAVFALERYTRRITKGRKGVIDLAGLPSAQLTVPGRRSGVPRTVSLLYVPDPLDDKRFLLVSSNWGRPEQPAWSANLRSVERAELRVRGERFEVSARELTDVERERAWHRAVVFWPGYAMEQELAGDRRFRLFELLRD